MAGVSAAPMGSGVDATAEPTTAAVGPVVSELAQALKISAIVARTIKINDIFLCIFISPKNIIFFILIEYYGVFNVSTRIVQQKVIDLLSYG